VILFAILETVQMALIGTTLAVVLALPFGLLAARNTSPHRLVYQGTRLLLNANRAVPDIIFALIFVAAVGLGPFSGVLALAVGAIGFMGKLYAEAIESIDPQQVQAIRATGANRLQTFVFGAVPQALPLVAAYSLLLFETNVRSATILGIVGAGGVGFVLSKYMALFQYQRLLGALILIILAVTLIDRASDALRQRIT
jgi:phosphonate transport system permease protein